MPDCLDRFTAHDLNVLRAGKLLTLNPLAISEFITLKPAYERCLFMFKFQKKHFGRYFLCFELINSVTPQLLIYEYRYPVR